MKDNIKHIRQTHAERLSMSWCDKVIGSFEWTYKDIDHAAYDQQRENYNLVCKECADAVVKALFTQI